MKKDDRRIVYSTDVRGTPACRACGQVECRCEEDEDKGDASRPRVQREKGGRGGKMVTVIYELNLPEAKLLDLCSRLKKRCASGGTVKEGNIEIQGDHADRIVGELKKEGFKARRSGG